MDNRIYRLWITHKSVDNLVETVDNLPVDNSSRDANVDNLWVFNRVIHMSTSPVEKPVDNFIAEIRAAFAKSARRALCVAAVLHIFFFSAN